MKIPDSSSIKLVADGCAWTFFWSGFDGDDCFASFRLAVTQPNGAESFDFGPCVVHSFRKTAKFIEQNAPNTSVSGGFQNPGVCSYELRTDGARYELVVEFEDLQLKKHFTLDRPKIELDIAFLRAQDGESF